MYCFFNLKILFTESGDKSANIQYISCDKPPPPPPPTNPDQPTIAPGDNYSYVQLTAVHDYNYPVVDEPVSSVINARRDSSCSLKKRSALDVPTPVLKEGSGGQKSRPRCRYCQEFFSEEWNRTGSCDYAPDCFQTGINAISGMICARCMIYHCMRDAEGEMASHPCLCNGETGCTKRLEFFFF